jgi:hypothetical protein
MRNYAGLLVVLLPVSVASANPIDPIGSVLGLVPVAYILALETIVGTFFLLFAGMSGVNTLPVLYVGNLVVYFAFFLPLRHTGANVLFAETAVVAADGAFMKLLSTFDVFQSDTFTVLKWRYAFIIAALGNAISYYLGTMVRF